jgi:hypothetical protein
VLPEKAKHGDDGGKSLHGSFSSLHSTSTRVADIRVRDTVKRMTTLVSDSFRYIIGHIPSFAK